MIKTALQCLTVLLLLAGCAIRPIGPGGAPFDPLNPRVYVINDKLIAVDQEPIYITVPGEVTIVWELPWHQKFTFPADGIVIKGGAEEFACGVEREGARFACRFKNSKRQATYKYTINVQLGNTRLRPLDPTIFSDYEVPGAGLLARDREAPRPSPEQGHRPAEDIFLA